MFETFSDTCACVLFASAGSVITNQSLALAESDVFCQYGVECMSCTIASYGFPYAVSNLRTSRRPGCDCAKLQQSGAPILTCSSGSDMSWKAIRNHYSPCAATSYRRP